MRGPLGVLIGLVLATPVLAQTSLETVYPVVTLGMLTYVQYDAEFLNREGYNAFDITRGYINVGAALTPRISGRLTPDIRRQTDGSLAGSLVLRLKLGYIDFHNVGVGTWIRAGLHQTPWLDFEEGVNRYRVQGTMFSEREGIIPGSSDFGVGMLGQLPAGRGEFQAGVYNGEGHARAEVNSAKSLQGRLTVRPFVRGLWQGLRLSAFGDLGSIADGQPRRHALAMISYESTRVVTTFQGLRAFERPMSSTDSDRHRSGYSAFLEVRQNTVGAAAFVRFDRLQVMLSSTATETSRMIVGGAYWTNWDRVRLGFVVSDEDVRKGSDQPELAENRLLAQLHIQY